ncbi:phytanoyl-CoA dioxygenase family protein [Niveispirillum fermenti]|uniref:phytanoyl-CoA dioxygenase family protein n=1 Tax=Niveispirillum fermenti TaxID=1233113 RepID=UPI003A84D8F2
MGFIPDMTFFRENGYCVVPGLLDPAQCEALRLLLTQAQAKADRGEGEERWRQDGTAWEPADGDGAARIVRRVPAPFEHSAVFRSIFGGDRVLDLVERFIGPRIYLHSSKMLYKPPFQGRRKPFHQDLAYWPDMTGAQVTIWCPIDPATAGNGCMEVVPGSHSRGMLEHHELEDWQIEDGRIDPQSVRVIEMAAGDALFLDVLTIHASRPNRSDRGRLAAIVNYIAAPRAAGQHSRYGTTTPLRPAGLPAAAVG